MQPTRFAVISLAAVVLAFAGAVGHAQTPEPAENPRIEELRQAGIKETDADKREKIWRELSDLECAEWNAAAASLHARWQAQSDPAKRAEMSEDLADLGVKVSNCETGGNNDKPATLVIEVATDGQYPGREITYAKSAKALPLRELRTLRQESDAAWVIRRMTRTRLEVWQPRHGWLFDGHGKVVAEAFPPRRDGSGRQWYGAFLPDGRWVTTDLFDQDQTLTFFTRAGKWLKEIAAENLVPRTREDDPYDKSTIGWCRCTRDGDAFVLSVGQNGGRGQALVKWNGEHRALPGEEAEATTLPSENPWKLCYPRDLEPKGTYTALAMPNDRNTLIMFRHEDSHGTYVGFPVYEAGDWQVRVPNGETFGFWPASDARYVVIEHENGTRDELGGWHCLRTTYETWFYDETGQFAGWIAAKPIADTASGDGMLFIDAEQRVVSLGRDHAIRDVHQFHWRDGAIAEPIKLYPDLRLGFFARDKDLVVAMW